MSALSWKQYFIYQADYQHWANEVLFECLDRLDPKALAEPQGLFFSTIHQTVDILENYARGNNIDIQTDLADNLPISAGDQAQLQQVILNLVNNAIDAIGKDGTISIKSLRDSSKILVMITDTGPGIPESMQKKIFDPFFTTKSTGKGTGLGLWISYNIIEKMGGNLALQSREGQGATFTITLPIVPPMQK
jgi:two-component system NtrC family sensor kinase